MKMKKKFYEQPIMEVVELEQTDLICASATTMDLQDGGTIDWFDNTEN